MTGYLILIKTLVTIEGVSFNISDGQPGEMSNITFVRREAGGSIDLMGAGQYDVREAEIPVIWAIVDDHR